MKAQLQFILSFCLSMLFICNELGAQAPTAPEAAEYEMLMQFFDSLEQAMRYETGVVVLNDGLATLEVPAGYKYLNPEQSAYVLTDLWGNPPNPTLGLLFPEEGRLFDTTGYVIELTYDEMGYVDDSEARSIDFDALLKEMKAESKAQSALLKAEGYVALELVGWAEPPYYDESSHQLYWAMEFRQEEYEENTLNYHIKVLGRKGVLNLNFIATTEDLNEIRADLPQVLPSVRFNDGFAYEDYNPGIDQVAAVGLGGLVAGKVLAKSGALAAVAKFFKFIVFGIVAFASFLWKSLRGSREAA